MDCNMTWENVIDELRNGLSVGRASKCARHQQQQCACMSSARKTQTQILYQEKKNHNLVLLGGGWAGTEILTATKFT